jgi:hypothetical protein
MAGILNNQLILTPFLQVIKQRQVNEELLKLFSIQRLQVENTF